MPEIYLLIIEDEAILALDLRARLEREGYRVVGVANNGRKALALFEQTHVDLILCDIHIKGDWNGIETARQLLAVRQVPLIYLTAFTDAATVEQAKQTFPAAYLTKPVTTDNLRLSIEMALNNFAFRVNASPKAEAQLPVPDRTDTSGEAILMVNDSIFIKQNYQFVRIPLHDLLFLETDASYTTLVTSTKKHTLRLTLTAMLERLANPQLVRTHRSYAVNLEKVDTFNEYELRIQGQIIPLGRSYKEEFLRHFRFR